VGPAVGASAYGGNYNFPKSHKDNHTSGIDDFGGSCRLEKQSNS
jgi:hypothetical protein